MLMVPDRVGDRGLAAMVGDPDPLAEKPWYPFARSPTRPGLMTDLTPFKVPCSSCGRIHLVDPALVPRGGLVGCRVCGAKFSVLPPARAPSAPRPQPPPAPASAVSVRLAWVFPDDPAMQRPGVLQIIRSELTSYRTRLMDSDARHAFRSGTAVGPDWVQIFEIGGCLGDDGGTVGAPDWPHVVLFGDMHVLLEDNLLQTVANRPGVHRVLVSTHDNPELVLSARQFCGFDRHLILPFNRAHVRAALEPQATRTL
jgi:hypothetical protein